VDLSCGVQAGDDVAPTLLLPLHLLAASSSGACEARASVRFDPAAAFERDRTRQRLGATTWGIRTNLGMS
jgi:hypothetical protein